MFEHRIAVTGLTGAGKTVFLTSLLDHWTNHDPTRFELGRDGKTEMFCKWDNLDDKRRYEERRELIRKGEWPDKTLCHEEYKVQVRIDRMRRHWYSRHRKRSWRNVTLIDIPGERFADADMLRFPKYSGWSEETMHRLKSKLDDNAAGDAREFLTLYDEINEAPLAEGAERLRDAYQRMMANFIRRDNPFVTPSSLLIDDQNKFVPSNIVAAPDPEILHQWLSERAHCGLPNEPVFPLPPSFNATDVGKRIAANYKKYRRQVVVPALGPLVGCRDLLVLVDVAGILELGPQWKNALVDAFSSIVGAVSPRGVMWRAIHNVGRIAHGRWIADYVHRVWFVAAQCDRVHRNEHERLLKLLDSLMRQATREHAGDARLKREKIRVAAIDCVRPGEQGRQNYFCRTPLEEIRLAEANPVALPEEFADDWPAGVYAFPKPAIMMPKNRGNPPRQFGLDCLTERLLGLR